MSVLAVAWLCAAADVSAHGPPAAATGLLALRGEEATLVQLTRGLAHRVSDGFRFICPEAWGGDVSAPAATIPGGAALIASEQLFVVASDGRVSLHPSQVGVGSALTSQRDAAFGLFKRDGRLELWRLTEDTSELLRVLDEPFRALAASDSQLALLGWSGATLTLQTLSLTGELRERLSWNAPSAVAYAELRSAEDQLYVSIWGSSRPWVTLDRVTAHGYERLREAFTGIAGPVARADGTWLGLDGTLEGLEQGNPVDVDGDYVTCLGKVSEQLYACAGGDLVRVDPNGLGAPLFELSALREPDYQTLPEAARSDCTTRWLDLREHVAAPVASDIVDDSAAPEPSASEESERAQDGAKTVGCALGTARTRGFGWSVIAIALGVRRRRRPVAR